MSIGSLGSSAQPSFSFDGVLSGLNTTDIISKLLSLDKGPLIALQKQQHQVQARDTAYQAVKAKVAGFQTAVQNLLLASSVNAKTATSATPAVATATANSSALNGPFTVNVLQLATATSVKSSAAIGNAANMAGTTLISNANLALPATSGTFTINGQSISITVGAGGDTWSSLQSKISSATGGAVTLNLGANGVTLTSASPMQIGASTDTSNFLSAIHALGAPQTGSGPYTVTNNQPLGAAQAANPLSSANLAVAGGIAASGTFQINGVSINWNNTDSINAVLNRINASSAGVMASYDPTTDKVVLTNQTTGASSISLSDTSGNFLQAMGLLGASQSVGSAAQYTITQNGVTSATQFSNSNTVNNALPGVNLTLASNGSAVITVAQDTTTTTNNIQAFVTQFNALVDEIENDTKYDPNTKASGPLQGDPTILGIDDQVRSLVSSAAVVPSGAAYSTLASIGITTGAFGSAVGTTNHLTVDTGKLTTALQTNPQAVYNVLAGLTGTTSVTGDPTNPWIASVTGTPAGQVYSGTYKITYNPTGNALSSVLTQSGGAPQTAVTGTISAGGVNNTLIPGLVITANNPLPGASGTDTVTYTVNTRGVMQSLNDYLNNVLGASGIFQTESNDAQSSLTDITDQIANQNELLDQKQQALQQQFTAMEVALSQLQAQNSSLVSSLGGSTRSSSSK
jgi:flagellar hook-associated protein 2